MNEQNKNNPIIIIPARMDASRFYGKPLELINNVPMVVRIMRQAETANLAKVVVATPDEEIAKVVTQNGGNVVITSKDCATGTDRIAEAINKLDPDCQHNIVVNLQGDLALFDNEVLISTLRALENHQDFDMSTACTLIVNEDLKNNPNTAKAVVSFFKNSDCGKALYFTRSTCPYGEGELYQHLGIYAYKRKALERFVASPPSTLETRENLEQLRALELGLNIVITKVKSIPLEVNTKEDLDIILEKLKTNK